MVHYLLPMGSFGVVYPAHALPEALPAFVSEIEADGFDELWMVEDCFLSGGMTLATIALARSDTLRVGIGLLPAAVRNPAIVAMEIATLARAYPGRVTIAFGHGVEGWMQQIGARPPRRVGALGEVVTAVRSLLAGETQTVAGAFVTLDAVALDHPPDVVPEILIGTTGPQAIALAARHADGLLLPEGCGPRFIARARAILDSATSDADPRRELVTYAWSAASDDARTELRGAVERWRQSGLYPGPVEAASGSRSSPEASEDHRLPARLLDEVAITGSPANCVDSVRRFLAEGADRLVFLSAGRDFRAEYSMIAEEVLPKIKCSSAIRE